MFNLAFIGSQMAYVTRDTTSIVLPDNVSSDSGVAMGFFIFGCAVLLFFIYDEVKRHV